MDITSFMTWFISQVVSIFSFMFTTLDSITFMGTSLLKVILTILILGSLLSVVLTLSKSVDYVASKSERSKNRNRGKNEKKD